MRRKITKVGPKKYSITDIAPRIERFLRPVLDLAGFQLRFEVVEPQIPHPEIEDPDLMVRFSGPDVDLLLANRAELLLALEHLTMEVLHLPSEDHEKICFDAEDYRLLRIEELRLSAMAAAERVKTSRVPFRFSPMTSRERRIVHLALRNEPAVRSESSGTGPARQVVIYPADMPSLPDAPRPPLMRRGRRR